MTDIPPPTVPPATPPPPGGGSYTPPPPPPSLPPGGAANSDRTVMLVLSYAWLFSLIPLFMKKDDPEVQWHAKNGVVMAGIVTAVDVVFWIMGRFFPLLTCLVSFVPCLLFIGYVVVQIMCIVKAVNGQRMRIPGITDFAEKLNI
jgi:uncharacterized membrane protein